MLDLNRPLKDCTFVAFDTETSGAYPIGHDIVEFGAVKWYQGQEVGRLQFLLKPREKMTDFIIGIHGITNEMVETAPTMAEKIHEIHEFVKDSIVMAHHAPFDLGFVTVDFEKALLPMPTEPALCTSLLSRKWIHGVENHKLQTLVKHLNIDGGTAHRAYDDAKACLQVGLKCFELMGENTTLGQAIKSQGKALFWKDYTLIHGSNESVKKLISATYDKKDIDMIYDGGSNKGETRRLTPVGIVRNPDGDYLYAFCHREQTNKRYYLSRIKEVEVVF
ncbi:exonuclease domain-containing protein [Bdellovibrio sp. HCB2-146]|uniref:exonuclease domain-containing protein n=1 Tax=Bdellovibrio sp. HCB2-146 TaxID=3394362 RepID=UPI0039BC7217